MKISLKLFVFEKEAPGGFPLVFSFFHSGNRKRKTIAFCKKEHFIEDGAMISEKHPDYVVLMPIILDLKIKAKKIMLQGVSDIDLAYSMMFGDDGEAVGFIDFAKQLTAEMLAVSGKLAKHDFRQQNKMLGNIAALQGSIAVFEPFAKKTSLANLSYNDLLLFKNHKIGIGNSKATIHLYLRELRSLYNKGVLKYNLENKKPFSGIFDGLKTKSYNSRKKYLDKSTVEKMENLDLQSQKQKYVDLFLLQFYFGGCDLIDVYYLRKDQLRKGRVVFERTKTNTGIRIDLKVHPKAQAILKKYENKSEWLFPWDKDKKSYTNFRRAFWRGLIYVQEKNEIEILPDGGFLAVKVARHTFGNLAKKKYLEPDMIRELMGHERDDVDNFYKDKYPEAERDKALFDIIG